MASAGERVTPIIVEQLGVNEDKVITDASFTEDLGADSLDQLRRGLLLGGPVDAADDVSPDQRYQNPRDLDRCHVFAQDHDAEHESDDRYQVSNDRGPDGPDPTDQPDEQSPDDAGAYHPGDDQGHR